MIEIHDENSYVVQTPAGGIYRRNRRMLNKTKESFPQIQEFSPDILARKDHNNPLQAPNDRKIPSSNNDDHSLIPDKPSQTELNYQTRSGREVKPNQRYYDSNWINK